MAVGIKIHILRSSRWYEYLDLALHHPSRYNGPTAHGAASGPQGVTRRTRSALQSVSYTDGSAC